MAKILVYEKYIFFKNLKKESQYILTDFLSLAKFKFMSISDIFNPGFKQRNRAHFAAIVRVALADGVITDEEKAFINRTAINLEIDDSEVEKIMSDPDSYPINPPASGKARLERLYDLTRMVYADNIADDAEIQLLNRLAIGLGYAPDESSQIANKALALVADGRDEDDFVASF